MPAEPSSRAPSGGRRTIALAAVVAAAAFALVAWGVGAPTLILCLNGIAVAMTLGVLHLYGTAGLAALVRPRPVSRDWLVAGAVSLAAAFLASRLVSIAARDLGLVWIVDSDLLGLRVALSLFGMLCLLKAPFAGAPSVSRRWRGVALWAGVGVLLSAALLLLHHGRPPGLLPLATPACFAGSPCFERH